MTGGAGLNFRDVIWRCYFDSAAETPTLLNCCARRLTFQPVQQLQLAINEVTLPLKQLAHRLRCVAP
jgi:hypothetical protein